MSDADFVVPRDKLSILLDRLAPTAQQPNRVLFLSGPPGTGKTSEFHALAQRSNQANVLSIQAHPEQSFGDVVGGLGADGKGGLIFQPGPLLRIWKTGGMLIIDDLHLAGPDAMAALYLALDNRPTVSWTGPDGTVYRPEKPVWTCLTSNGTRPELDEPIDSRIFAGFIVSEPSSAMLATLEPHIAQACRMDYQSHANGQPLVMDFRKWQSVSEATPITNLKWALVGSLGSDEKRVTAVAQILAAIGMPQAISLVQELATAKPSGAPQSPNGSY